MKYNNLSSKPEQISKSASLISERIFGEHIIKNVSLIGKNQFVNSLEDIFKKSRNYNLNFPDLDIFDTKIESDFNREILELLIYSDIFEIGTKTEYLIKQNLVLQALKKRKQRPILILDLSIPGNAESDLMKLDNCFLFDLNDLEQFFSNKVIDYVNTGKNFNDDFSELVDKIELFFKTEMDSRSEQVYHLEEKLKEYYKSLNKKEEKRIILNFLSLLLKK